MSPHIQPSSAAFIDPRISSLRPFSGGQILTNALSQRGDVSAFDENRQLRQKKKTEEEEDRGKKRHRVRYDRMAISQSNRMRI